MSWHSDPVGLRFENRLQLFTTCYNVIVQAFSYLLATGFNSFANTPVTESHSVWPMSHWRADVKVHGVCSPGCEGRWEIP